MNDATDFLSLSLQERIEACKTMLVHAPRAGAATTRCTGTLDKN